MHEKGNYVCAEIPEHQFDIHAPNCRSWHLDLLTANKTVSLSLFLCFYVSLSFSLPRASFEVSEPQCLCCQAALTRLCGCITSFSQVPSALLHWHVKVYETAIKTSVAQGPEPSEPSPRDRDPEMAREMSWSLKITGGDIPRLAANFTIIINLSL